MLPPAESESASDTTSMAFEAKFHQRHRNSENNGSDPTRHVQR